MTVESITLKAGELLLPGYNFIVGCELEGMYFRFTINEKKIGNYDIGKTYNIEVPDKKLIIPSKLTGIKQLGGYANKTSSFANYELGEAVYELKLVPENSSITKNIYVNMTVLLEGEK
jgi:HlyD family secretion protein